jgi:VanZ family protein
MGSRTFVKYWLPVVVWMLLIFSASTDMLSTQRTSRFIGPFLRWFSPDISESTVKQVQLVIRKIAHLTEYAILAGLLWRAFRKPQTNDSRPWSWRQAGWAWAFTALYAVTDEVHQSFVASRHGSPWDVLIDITGAALGVFLIWQMGRRRKAW